MSEFVKHALENTIQNLKSNPQEANAVFKTQAVLKENVKVKVGAREFNFSFDEPSALGGENTAPNPIEYLLGSLGACQAIVYRALASLKGINIESLTINTDGHLNLNGFLGIDPNTRPGLSKIEFETIIVSNETDDTLKKLAAQVESLCPVLDILSNPLEITGKLNIIKKEVSV